MLLVRLLLLALLLLAPFTAQAVDTVEIGSVRTSGAPPFGVVFEAFKTSTFDDYTTIPERWRDVYYVWDFDDSSGTWDLTTGASKDVAYGSVVFHSFDADGTYDVQVTAYDADGVVLNTDIQVITVTSPAAWDTTGTTCISSSGNFTACPADAREVSIPGDEADWDNAVRAAIAANSLRILTRAGESFTANAEIDIEIDGPGLIGSYDTGAKPLINTGDHHVFKVGALIPQADGGTDQLIEDWRMVGLDFDGFDADPCDVSIINDVGDGGNFNHILFMNNDFRNYGNALSFYGNYNGQRANNPQPQIGTMVIGNKHGSPMGRKSAFVGSLEFAMVGNDFTAVTRYDTCGTNHAEHTYRISYAGTGVVSHNYVDSAGLDAGTLRARDWNGGVESGHYDGRYTEYIFLRRNRWKGCADIDILNPDGWGLTTNTSDDCNRVTDLKGGDTTLREHRDIIYESNWITGGDSTGGWGVGAETQNGLAIDGGTRVTVRNNLCDMTNSHKGTEPKSPGIPAGAECTTNCNTGTCINISNDQGGDTAVDHVIANNSSYNGYDTVNVGNGTGHIVTGNLHFTNNATEDVVSGTTGSTLADNVLGTTCPYATCPPTTVAHYDLLVTSTEAIDVVTPNDAGLFDFVGNERLFGSAIDAGAYEYGSSPVVPDAGYPPGSPPTDVLCVDTTPPDPTPMTWVTVPTAVDDTQITMTATTAVDATTPPEAYFFECTTDGTKSSTWQSGSTYVATTLTPDTSYSFRVKARDSVGTPNETAYSTTESATTDECSVPGDCPDDGLFCTGAVTCTAGVCGFAGDPCPGQICNDTLNICEAIPVPPAPPAPPSSSGGGSGSRSSSGVSGVGGAAGPGSW